MSDTTEPDLPALRRIFVTKVTNPCFLGVMVIYVTPRTPPRVYICRSMSEGRSTKMREYEHEASEVTIQDVGCAWLIVGVFLSAMFLLPVVLEASVTLTLPF